LINKIQPAAEIVREIIDEFDMIKRTTGHKL
jgi:hypothetical protein